MCKWNRLLLILAVISIMLCFTACDQKIDTVSSNGQYVIADEAVIDNEYCSFIVNSVEKAEEGIALNVTIKNKSDMKFWIYSYGETVNDYLISAQGWNIELAIGGEITSVITFPNEDLGKNDIDFADKITLKIGATDANVLWGQMTFVEEVSFYPTGMNADSYVEHSRSPIHGEHIIVDDENYTFIVESVEMNEKSDYVISYYAENKTDKPIWLSWDSAALNGCLFSTTLKEELAGGQKIRNEEVFTHQYLSEYAIDSVEEIEFLLNIFYKDTNTGKYVYDIRDHYAVYPTGKSAATIDYPERIPVAGEDILIDNEFCTFSVIGNRVEEVAVYGIKCYFENKTDQDLAIVLGTVSLDGKECENPWDRSLSAGMREIFDLSFFWTDYNEKQFLNAKEIDLELKICDVSALPEDEWAVPYIDEIQGIFDGVFTYTPQQ